MRLHLDELHEVYEVLSEYCKEGATIETCGYRISDLNELAKLPVEQTNELYINSTNRYLQISLTQNHGTIRVGSGNIEAEGLVSRIEKILLKGKIRYPALPESTWIPFPTGLPLLIGLIIRNKILTITGGVIFLVYILWGLIYIRFTTKRYSTIVFKLRKETPSFWKRNKDQLVMLIVGTIIVGVVTKVIDLLLK